MKVEKISTEVAVIGGGGAGLLAALEARRSRSEVLLISKTLLGGGSCTTLSFGVFRAADGAQASEEHFSQSIASGKNLNDRRLLRILVDEAFDRVRGLEEYGVPITYEAPYFYVLGKAPFYGQEMTVALQEAAKELGIASLGQTIVIELLKADNRVCGLLAYSPKEDTLLIINARAVVLATGGSGALYPLHDNSPRTTGDGFALSGRAGAVLQDMEFVQFYPLGLVEDGIFRCIVPPLLGECGHILNALGENILDKYRIEERPAAVKARDSLSQAMFREISAGRGFGPCLGIDLSVVEEKDWEQNRQMRHYRKILLEKYPGMDRPLKIAPVCHHFMGGVVIDEECKTSLPGLFAAGEVTGGLHGANRMGGNALSECVVFGTLAGRQAASYAARAKTQSFQESAIRRAKDQVNRWRELPPGRGQSPRQLKKRLAQIMFTKAGIVRNREQLEEAEKEVDILAKEGQAAMYCKNPKDVMRAFELNNQITTARLVIRGALIRTESRGSQYREDFPHTDESHWQTSIRTDGVPWQV